MSHLKSKKLLVNAAKAQRNMKEKISRKEIEHKINEIKYLASQKNVPKLSLRKEIIHLENKLENVFEMEKKLLHTKNNESTKISSLKRQIDILKTRLEHAQDEDLREKVGKLSHLLGDALAKSQSKTDIKLSKEILSIMDEVEKAKRDANKDNKLISKRVIMILHRVKSLKHEIEINAKLQKGDPGKLKKISDSLNILEQKLEAFKTKNPQLFASMVEALDPNRDENVKHSMLFSAEGEVKSDDGKIKLPDKSQENVVTQVGQPSPTLDSEELDEEMIHELPLPPPPKIRKRKKKDKF
jgi:hypothetical protein